MYVLRSHSVREITAVGGWPFGPPSDPLFPSSSGHVVSKLHMLMPWANHLDKDMTGLDRTFSKEIRRHGLCKKGGWPYLPSRAGGNHLQCLGTWKRP